MLMIICLFISNSRDGSDINEEDDIYIATYIRQLINVNIIYFDVKTSIFNIGRLYILHYLVFSTLPINIVQNCFNGICGLFE